MEIAPVWKCKSKNRMNDNDSCFHYSQLELDGQIGELSGNFMKNSTS